MTYLPKTKRKCKIVGAISRDPFRILGFWAHPQAVFPTEEEMEHPTPAPGEFFVDSFLSEHGMTQVTGHSDPELPPHR